MVDKLKASLENLDPPECPHCRHEMKWVQSNLIQSIPAFIEHHFVCGTCRRRTLRHDKVDDRPQKMPPGKLSREDLGRAA